jgi:hypothetical protein
MPPDFFLEPGVNPDSSPGHFAVQASSFTDTVYGFRLVAYFEEKLRSILATLEACQAALASNGDRDTAQLVSVAILELRIKLNRIEDSELKALCDVILTEGEIATGPIHPKPQEGVRQRLPVSLKLVK